MSFSTFMPPAPSTSIEIRKSKIENHLTPTHVFTDDPTLRVCAWQYQRSAPIPVWVARQFHQLSDASAFTGIAADGSLVSCLELDWIVALDNSPHGYVAVVLSPREFTRCFLAL